MKKQEEIKMVRWGGLIDAMVDNCADVIVWDWAYVVDIFADVYVEYMLEYT